MAIDNVQALALVKARLNRMPNDITLDNYLAARIDGAVRELERTGIILTNTPDDMMLVVDYTVYQYQNRDKPGGMPEWLRLRRRERWMRQEVGE